MNVDSGKITTAIRKWSPKVVPGSGGFGYEFDPDEYVRLLADACREAMQTAGAKPDEVKGIACASIRHSLVLVDGEGHELLALPNKDGRSGGEGLMLGMEHGDELYTRCGHFPSAIFLAARLQWAKANHPNMLDNVKAALAPDDWLAWKLTGGECATDFTQAGESLLLELNGNDWNDQLCESLGIPRILLPAVKLSGTPLGTLTSDMAASFGLQTGTPMIVGGADTQMAMIGSGAVDKGSLAIVSGSTTPVMMSIDQPLEDANQKVWTSRHALEGKWVLESNAGPMGETLEWMSALLNPASANPIARFCAQAAKAKPGCEGMLTAPAAQVMDARNMTLPLASFMINQMDDFNGTTCQELLARSALEGLAFIAKANADQLLAAAPGLEPNYFLAGGMTRSNFWCQLVSDVLATPVAISETSEASGLGTALAAGVGAGTFKDFDEAILKLVHTRMLEPNATNSGIYKDLYSEWLDWYQKQKDARDLAAGHNMNAVIERASVEENASNPLPKLILLVTAQFEESGLAKLRQFGEVDYQNYREPLNVMSGSDLGEALKDSNVLITEVDMLDVDALKSAPNLRVAVSCRGNAVNINLSASTAFGVPVLNAPGRNADAVADLAVSFMLMLLRKLAPAGRFLHEPGGEAGDLGRSGMAFAQFLGGELWGKTVGLGAVGRRVARRLQGFGANVLVYDPYLPAEEIYLIDAEPVSLDELLPCSDIISLHAAVTDETRGMIGKDQFNKMKIGAIFINTARAALVDEAALEAALKSGKLAGAGLNVFSVEPPSSDHPLLRLENVVATPHIGGNTIEVAAH